MHFTALILLVAGAAAYTIPEGQADGTYEVYMAPDGTEVHTLVETTVEPRSPIPDKFAMANKRANTNIIECGGYALPPTDVNNANFAVDARCGGGASINARTAWYSLKGCTVAYFCNYTGGPQFCYKSERESTSRAITGACGLFNAGWMNIQDDGRNVQYGYENNCNQGWNFCGCGTDGC